MLNAESIAAVFPACSTSQTLCLGKEKHFTDLVPSNTNLFYDSIYSRVILLVLRTESEARPEKTCRVHDKSQPHQAHDTL